MLFCLLIIFLFETNGCVSQPAKNEIKVGAILPLSGWGAYDGDPVKKGMLLAAEDINDPTFKLIIEDAQSDNKVAVAAASKLLDVDGVDVVLSQFSGISSAVSPVVLDQNKVFIYSGYSPAILEQNKYSFKVNFDSYSDFKQLTRVALNDGKNNLAVLVVQADIKEPIVKAVEDLREDYNFRADYYEFAPPETDFRTIMLKVKGQNADAIIGAGYEENFLNIFAKNSAIGGKIPIYCGGIYDCLTDKVKPTVNGFPVTTFDMLINESFKQKYFAKYPKASNSELEGSAMGYDMVLYTYTALAKCPSKDRACIMQSLIDENVSGAMNTKTGFNSERRFEIGTLNLRYIDSNFYPVN